MGWASAAANVVGALGGALIGRSGQGKAIGAQERATMAQIQLERDRDAAKQKRYESGMADYRREKENWDNIRRTLLSHYLGVQLPGGGGQAPGGAPPGNTGFAGGTLGQLAGGISPQPPVAMGMDPMGTGAQGGLPDMTAAPISTEEAFDWRRYGVPTA